jgi:hypothetical protein
MSSTDSRTRKPVRELRRFGIVMAGALGLLGGIASWGDRPWAIYPLALAGAFLAVGLVAPRLLGFADKAWMAFAGAMSVVMTYVILTLSYYLMFTPISLLLRLLGKDLLELKRDPTRASFWVPVDPKGPGVRPDKPY